MPTVRKSLDDVEPIFQERLDELKAVRDEDIDYSDIPPLGADFWDGAEMRMPWAS